MKYRDFAKRMHALASPEVKDAFYNGCVNELAGRVLRKVKKKTPVGPGVFEVIYNDDGSVKKYKRGKRKGKARLKKVAKGGTLRRGWNATPSERRGGTYEAKVLNNVKYASYVEYGHRQHVGQFVPVLGKRLKKPWVPGQHMLQKAHDEVKKDVEKIVRRRFRQYLRKGFE